MSSMWFQPHGIRNWAPIFPYQAPSPCIFVLIAILALFILHIAKRREAERADKAFEQDMNCGAARTLQYRWPLAFDSVIETFRKSSEQQILRWFTGIFQEVGPTFERVLLGKREIVTIEPENIKSILDDNFEAYGVAARYPIFHVLLGGEGIFTQDGVSWKNSRNAISSLFKGIRADIVPRLEELTEGLLQRIPTEQFIDLQPMFFRFTFSTTIDLLFGKSIELPGSSAPIEGFLETEARFSEAFRKAQNFVVRRGRLGPFYFMDIWSQKHCSTVHQFIDAAIEKVLSGEYQKRSGDHSLLEHLIEKGIKNPRVLRDQLVNVMLAGRDTTACLLTWTFRLLAQHPKVLAHLRKEVKSTVGVGEQSRSPDRTTLGRMEYLKLVLREVLRLYPSVPVNNRTALRRCVLPRGGGPKGEQPLMIRKGESVAYSVYVMHRSKKLYGEDADSFRPERWDPSVDNPVNLGNIGSAYLPFNSGRRVCPGQNFALLEAGYVVVRMLQKFKSFELDPTEKDIAVGTEKQDLTIVLASSNGCRVCATSES